MGVWVLKRKDLDVAEVPHGNVANELAAVAVVQIRIVTPNLVLVNVIERNHLQCA